MNSVIAWFAENRVAANLLMVLILVAGGLSLPQTKKEILPEVSLGFILVTVPYPGASPSQVEKGVVVKIENALARVDGIHEMTSIAQPHFGVVQLEIEDGHNLRRIYEEIRTVVNGIRFPNGAEDPIVRDISVKTQVARVIVYGDADRRTLKKIAENVRQDLVDTDGISVADVVSKPFEISIELNPAALHRYNMTFSEVMLAIKKQSFEIPFGNVDVAGTTANTIFTGTAQTKDQFEDIAVRSLPDGSRILVKDVAEVIDGFSHGKSRAEFDGKPAMYVTIYGVGKENILDISEKVRNYIANPKTFLPEGIKLRIWQDTSVFFKSRVELLTENAIGGLVLVFVILMMFLRWRLSFWVSLGIPISFMGAFALLPIAGGTINMISLFAFILVLGIVVDDAIIVGENVFTHQKAGRQGLSGAISGAQEVANPVVFAVLTTIVMFTPILFLPGPEGKLMFVIPVVVIGILTISLMESLLILPAHLSAIKSDPTGKGGFLDRFLLMFSDGLENFVDRQYRPFLEYCLRWRYVTVAVFFTVFVLCLGLIGGGWVKTVFVSKIEADMIYSNLSFASGTKMEVTKPALKKIEQAGIELKHELAEEYGSDQIKSVLTTYGIKGTATGDNMGSVVLELAPNERRTISGEEITDRWRDKVGPIKDAVELDFLFNLNRPGPAIDLELKSSDLDQLRVIADDLRVVMSSVSGVYGIKDSLQKGEQEIRLTLTPAANDLGLKMDEVAAQVRQAFQGVEVQRVQRDNEEVKVMVTFPEELKSSLWYLENMSVMLPTMTTVPLMTIAEVEYGTGPASIKRVDGKRSVRVQAYVDERVTTPSRVMNLLKSDFLNNVSAKYPGASWKMAGVQKAKSEFLANLQTGYIIAMVVMYALMATLFKSYFQPLMVMYAIPYGIVGSLLGHWALGFDITLWSLIGMTAVSGVVVNDNLVLVDYVNRKREEGVALLAAIREAGGARFRPIILTSVTTFGGLVPLMLEKSVQAQFMIPMAISLAFGVMFATTVSLVLVPCAYHIVEDLHQLARRILPDSFFATYSVEETQEEMVTPEGVVVAVEARTPIQTESVARVSTPSETTVHKETIPVLSSDAAPEDGDESDVKEHAEDWNASLEDAYEEGFAVGLKGEDMVCPYQSEEQQASWEAGWDDGHEAYQLKNN